MYDPYHTGSNKWEEQKKYFFQQRIPVMSWDCIDWKDQGTCQRQHTIYHIIKYTYVFLCFALFYIYIIQIKICAEYRDMLPRPRLVCQEPGLRPIGRSPGVPDKSSRGLGSMSRYSAQILICFIAYIFLKFFHSSVGLVENFAGLPVCTVPSAIVHCNQNEAGHQTIKAPSMPCWDAAGPSKHSLAFKSQPGENDRKNGWNLYQ